jgi:hypothetical protein
MLFAPRAGNTLEIAALLSQRFSLDFPDDSTPGDERDGGGCYATVAASR